MDHHVEEEEFENTGGVQETVMTSPDMYLRDLINSALYISPPPAEEGHDHNHSLLPRNDDDDDTSSHHGQANLNLHREEEEESPEAVAIRKKQRKLEYQRKRARKLRDRGICIRCGRKRAEGGRLSCKDCRAIQRARYHAVRHRGPKDAGRAKYAGKARYPPGRIAVSDLLNQESQEMAMERAPLPGRIASADQLNQEKARPPRGIAIADLLNPMPMNYATEPTVINGREVAVVLLD